LFYCRICREWNVEKDKSHHHIKPWTVFHDDSPENILEVCRTPCHDALNELIKEKEDAILQEHEEIYLDALKEMSGKKNIISKYYGKIQERRRRRR
jgi:hypothetical protein